jgi:hypothetical protein
VSFLLGAPLAFSGVGHLANMNLFLDSVYRYELLPPNWVPPFAMLLPSLTTVVGIALLLGLFRKGALWLAAGLYLCFGLAQGCQLYFGGQPVDCGCFVWFSHQTNTWNVVVLGIACLCSLLASIWIRESH